jgi:hypothetical protein
MSSMMNVKTWVNSKTTSTDAGLEINDPPTQLTPVFRTPAPEGPFRDEVIVEVLSLNGVNYYGTITPI